MSNKSNEPSKRKLECFGNVGQMLPGAEWVVVVWDPRSFWWNICLFICFTKEKKQRSVQQKDSGFQALQYPIDWLTSRLDWQLLAHKGTLGVIWSFLFKNCTSLVWEYQSGSKLPCRGTLLLNLTVETLEALRRRGTGPATEVWNTLIYTSPTSW